VRVTSPADLSAGHVLAGRYHLRGPLGRGGCATVYDAHDTALDRDVAIKVWHDPAEGAAEARLTARLHHPGVVVVHDAHTDGEVPFLVMERVDGVSLDTELGLGPLPPRRTRQLVGQLAATLALVHEDGIVHGDVKPGNVLLGPGDRVTLTDFGVAGPTRTQHSDVAVGTPHYLSPEQVRGRPVTAATDVYALGLVLLECLTATRAYPGPAAVAAAARLHRAPTVPSYVPADLAALVREMTDLDPARRPTAAAVAARLESPDTRTDTTLLPVGPPTRPVAVEGRQRWALVGAALLAVVLGLAVTGPSAKSADSQSPAQVATTTSPSARPSPSPRAVPAVQRSTKPAAPAPVHHKGHGRKKHH
jgi:serine/threonine protein kinase